MTFQDNTAALGQTVTYWAAAQSTVGMGPNSNSVSVTIPPRVVAPTGIVAPVITGALSTKIGISLAWRYTGAGASSGFVVHRSDGQSYPVSATTRSFIDTHVASGKTYTYWVAARNPSAEGPLSNGVTARR